MAPPQTRQILVWTLPSIAIFLSYLWYKKKRLRAQCDHSVNSNVEVPVTKSLKEELEEAIEEEFPVDRSFSRSLSGVDSAPIDIIIPRELRTHKSNPVVISDEDLDLEIEKIKSMKNTSTDQFRRSKSSDAVDSGAKRNSPNKPREETKKVENSFTMASTPSKASVSYKSPKIIKCSPQKVVSSTSPMIQKKVVAVEKKFGALKLDTQDSPKKSPPVNSTTISSTTDHEELHRQSSERDSANHSPADVMLASPSLSSISDNHSEGSNDSGKGGSDVATPPSRTPAGDGSITGDAPQILMYQTTIPQHLVGRLIGRHGTMITEIKEKSGTHIFIRKHPTNSKMKLCVVEGTQADIDNAIKMIRERFPLKRYPDLSLEQDFNSQFNTLSLTPDQLHLKLVEGINNDTIVSCMVAPNHFFLQHPTHPTFPNLNVLNGYMNMCYNSTESPVLPNPILDNTICAAQSEGDWYRAMVLSANSDTNTSHVIFLDYGGYAYLENSKLRQIRGDFLLLPFQASECILANVRPVGSEDCWSEDAYTAVAELTKGALTYTQVAEYTTDGLPLILMYILIGPQEVIFLNQELVNRGFAEWIPLPEQEDSEGAVGGVSL